MSHGSPAGAGAGSGSGRGAAAVATPRAPGITSGEVMRKVVHMGVGTLAFALRWLGPFWGAMCALAAVVFNLFLLPRLGGRRLLREAELGAGRSLGILLYPVTVLLLILIFYRRLEVAAAAWGILAFGDGSASVVGMTLGRRKLPWNRRKSWAGSIAYFVFGTLAAAALLLWTVPGRYEAGFALAVAAVATLVAAALESLPQGLDDNLGVPLVTGLLLFGLVLTQGGWAPLVAGGMGDTGGIGGIGGIGGELAPRLAVGAAVNLALAAAGYFARTVDLSGAVAGFALGTAIWGFLGWPGYAVLLAFFVVGSGLTKLGYRRKAAARLAQEKGGRRGARHAFANTGVAVACAVFAAASPYPLVFALAFAAAFATAAADTAGSEVGQLLGRRTFLITTLRPVPRGTDGAVSVEGTAAGVLAAVAIAALGWAVGLYPAAGVAVVAVAAVLGSLLESVFGATLESRALLDNEAINFLNTLVGALIAVGLSFLVTA